MAPRIGVQPLDFTSIKESSANIIELDYLSVCRRALENGFKHIEVLADIALVLPRYAHRDLVRGLCRLRDLGTTFSVHLPIWSIELASPNRYIRKASVKSIVEAINLFKPLEPECYVLHLTGALASELSRLNVPGGIKDTVLMYLSNYSLESIEEILEATDISPRLLAIENVEFPFNMTWSIIEQFDLSVCFDTGHLLAGFSGEYSFAEFVEIYGHRFIEIHLHDGYRKSIDGIIVRKDHLPLGAGDLPLGELARYIHSSGLSGPVVFELPLGEAIKSYRKLENVLATDRINKV